MAAYYVAAFLPEEDGGFSIFVPDIKGCITQSETLEEGVEMVSDALRLTLETMAFRQKDIPAPSTMERAKKKAKEYMKEIGYSSKLEVVYQLIKAPSLDMSPVKVTVSLPRSVLELADSKAQECGFTRSGLLARAVQEFHFSKNRRKATAEGRAKNAA